ncbi:unnamed protein product [Trypanosoma congolense IL3000]|uniref:WGS project CAEQ00000000 data, annotated contig 181 n=1 Tax=Trypanosoma congolense (strain IL3000) TaxID=1068625 RepID=F9W924_TRYCI|nr:unnamed protein product [Trypanosoma congolense IL3000]
MRFSAYILTTIPYLGARNVRALQGWAVKQAYELFDHVPWRVLEKASQGTHLWPVSLFPTLINSASDPDDLEFSSDSPTPEGTVLPDDAPRHENWTLLSGIQDILQEGCETWEHVSLADYFKECGICFNEEDLPTANFPELLQSPAQHIPCEKWRKRVLKDMSAKLDAPKTRVLGAVDFLHDKGINILDIWERSMFKDCGLAWPIRILFSTTGERVWVHRCERWHFIHPI